MNTNQETDPRPLMVSIHCITYNHEPYIRQCLEGFVMQKTNFRFEAIVHDDASTDGTADIIREYAEKYPDIIKPILETENQYSKHDGSLERIMNEACKGKYIAICEGDDYWIDPMKLQRQVDFLDAHLDYMMHFHNAIVRYQNHDHPDRLMREFESGEFDTERIYQLWPLPTASVVFRKELLQSDIYHKMTCVANIDLCYFAASSCVGKVYGLSECYSVYRKHDGGISYYLGAQFIYRVDYGIAKVTGNPKVLKFMERRFARDLTELIKPYFLHDPYAIEMVKLADLYNKRVFYLAMWNYFKSIPARILRKVKIVR